MVISRRRIVHADVAFVFPEVVGCPEKMPFSDKVDSCEIKIKSLVRRVVRDNGGKSDTS